MPLYEAVCSNCEAGYDYIAPVAKYQQVPECPLCGGKGHKVICSAPMSFVKGRFEPFKSNVDGSLISSQKDLEEHNKRNNVVQLAEGYDTKDIADLPMRLQHKGTDKKEVAEDVAQATHAVANGYRPIVKVLDDE